MICYLDGKHIIWIIIKPKGHLNWTWVKSMGQCDVFMSQAGICWTSHPWTLFSHTCDDSYGLLSQHVVVCILTRIKHKFSYCTCMPLLNVANTNGAHSHMLWSCNFTHHNIFSIHYRILYRMRPLQLSARADSQAPPATAEIEEEGLEFSSFGPRVKIVCCSG